MSISILPFTVLYEVLTYPKFSKEPMWRYRWKTEGKERERQYVEELVPNLGLVLFTKRKALTMIGGFIFFFSLELKKLKCEV